jgi:hypothetical protein
MKYFSKAKLGEMYEEDGWRLIVEIVNIKNDGCTTITAYSSQTSPTTIKTEHYPDGNYPEEINPDEWNEYYLESEYNLNDGFIDTITGKFYQVSAIEVYYYLRENENKEFTYTLKDVFGRQIIFDSEILSDYVDKGLYKYIKINNEINDCIEKVEETENLWD